MKRLKNLVSSLVILVAMLFSLQGNSQVLTFDTIMGQIMMDGPKYFGDHVMTLDTIQTNSDTLFIWNMYLMLIVLYIMV